MEEIVTKITNKLLKLHKDICILRESAKSKEEFDAVSVRAATVRECLHAIGNTLEEQQAARFRAYLQECLEKLAEGIYFQEILGGKV